MTKEELYKQYAVGSSLVKLITGVGNNAAWLVCLDALDKIRQHKSYKHQIKRAYKQAIEEFHRYERKLIHATQIRMFCVADMSDDIRKKYGDITDREYYDFWAAIGGKAYQRTHPMITSLQNKYRLSLTNHGILQPELLAWSMTALACLKLACQMYEYSIDSLSKEYHLPMPLSHYIFDQFSLKRVTAAWQRALIITDPKADSYSLNPTEERNIKMGLEQLAESWLDLKTLYGSTADTVVEYAEIFRTAGEMKKSLLEISEIENATYKELHDEKI